MDAKTEGKLFGLLTVAGAWALNHYGEPVIAQAVATVGGALTLAVVLHGAGESWMNVFIGVAERFMLSIPSLAPALASVTTTAPDGTVTVATTGGAVPSVSPPPLPSVVVPSSSSGAT